MDVETLTELGVRDQVEQAKIMKFFAVIVSELPLPHRVMQVYFNGVKSILKQRDDGNAKIDELNKQLVVSRNEIFENNAKVSAEKHNKISDELKSSQSKVAQLSEELKQTQSRVTKLSEELKQTQSSANQLSDELDHTKTKSKKRSDDLKKANSKISQLTDELAQKSKLSDDLQKKLSKSVQATKDLSAKCQNSKVDFNQFQKIAAYETLKYSCALDEVDNFIYGMSHLINSLSSLLIGQLKTQVASFADKLQEQQQKKIPVEFIDSCGHPIKCPVVTREGVVVSLCDVYQNWKAIKECTGVSEIAPEPQLHLFRSIACSLGICMQPPFKVQFLAGCGGNWNDLPFMDQMMVAFKIMRLCSRKEGKERVMVTNECCVLDLIMDSNGLLKFSASDGYSARMVIIDPTFDFGRRLLLQSDAVCV